MENKKTKLTISGNTKKSINLNYSKTNGKMRLEGKDYIVKDGDILNFRFNT